MGACPDSTPLEKDEGFHSREVCCCLRQFGSRPSLLQRVWRVEEAVNEVVANVRSELTRFGWYLSQGIVLLFVGRSRQSRI